MLETERYQEAVDLLEFLLQCQGQDPHHYDEWRALLEWLKDAFPGVKGSAEERSNWQQEDEGEEDLARRHAEAKLAEDQGYAMKMLNVVTNQPLSEHTFLALEQLAHLEAPDIDEALLTWLAGREHHPLLQFRVLQTLRRRGIQGTVQLMRGQELVTIEIETVPLRPGDFPDSVQSVLERVGQEAQIHDPTLFYFAQEFWYQFVMAVYGTMDYHSIQSEEDASLDIWAAALHQTVAESLADNRSDEEIRMAYGITDSMRLRFEQAYRSMKQFASKGMSV
ncbi:hypothetical protein [Paenibacillus sp. CAA11]|uniref:hypothetical protein n=1 Tax=Paenibacillus sp. CAA11 TaxID=1532905 RepID=UPI001F3403DE|nr:hypothetical protein [Paenibacillus sp. CAA11]